MVKKIYQPCARDVNKAGSFKAKAKSLKAKARDQG